MNVSVRRFDSTVYLLASLLVLIGACRESPKSRAADVSNADVRRLPPERKQSAPDVMVQRADRARSLGDDSARVTVFFVSDFQCAACRNAFEQLIAPLRDRYATVGGIRITLVQYPLREHGNAVRAASATMCAGAQDAFWTAATQVYAGQPLWESSARAQPLIDSLVGLSGVDRAALNDCIGTKRMLRQIRADIDWVDKNGLGAPPVVVVGNRRFSGTPPLADVVAAIDSALAGR